MKQVSTNKVTMKAINYESDDENTRYKLNKDFFNSDKPSKVLKQERKAESDDENIRYKFPTIPPKIKSDERKPKSKPKIKVNFWSNKRNLGRTNKVDISKENNRRHTIGGIVNEAKPKATAVKVRKRVSFLPSPIFTENHIPMVTVPDDLTIQLNEEEANDLGEDLNNAFVNINTIDTKSGDSSKRKSTPGTNSSPKGAKRKRNSFDIDSRSIGNEYELEFFSKYVVQKLRRMETNQRIYSENLINTVLMLGQLGKLNGKSKISEA